QSSHHLVPTRNDASTAGYLLTITPRPPPRSTFFPYTTLFRSAKHYTITCIHHALSLENNLNARAYLPTYLRKVRTKKILIFYLPTPLRQRRLNFLPIHT